MLKHILAVVILVHAVSAEARFSSSKDISDGIAIFSDKHSVIACTPHGRTNMCESSDGNSSITPAQYAGNHGYKVLHKVGIYIHTNGRVYILMEVSK